MISLLLPTRGRAALAERFMRSAAMQAENPAAVEVILRVDEDDAASHALDAAGLRAVTLVGPRAPMGDYNSLCLRRASGDIVVLCNDDVVIRTPGWDTRLREVHRAVPDAIYLAYPNDLYKGRRVCTFPVLSRRTCELLGDPFPAAYQGAFIDYHLLDIFKRLEHGGQPRLRYLEDVLFEHMHFRAGKGELDDTYRLRNRFGDDDTFLALRGERSRAARVLMEAIRRPAPASAAAPRPAAAPGARLVTSRTQFLAASILGDTELPWRWRWRLFVWFIGRSLAAGSRRAG